MTRSLLIAAIAATSVVVVNARPPYVARLPNGANVPNVPALGHIDVAGGGPINPFGQSFEAAGEQWNRELCMEDSDGDGQTNGQELGDPCCEWVANSDTTVRWTDGVSHPGDATLTSDPSLWAAVVCLNVTTAQSGNNTDTAYATQTGGSSNAANSITTPSGDTTLTTQSPTSADAPTPSTTSGAASAIPVSAVGVAAALVAYYL